MYHTDVGQGRYTPQSNRRDTYNYQNRGHGRRYPEEDEDYYVRGSESSGDEHDYDEYDSEFIYSRRMSNGCHWQQQPPEFQANWPLARQYRGHSQYNAAQQQNAVNYIPVPYSHGQQTYHPQAPRLHTSYDRQARAFRVPGRDGVIPTFDQHQRRRRRSDDRVHYRDHRAGVSMPAVQPEIEDTDAANGENELATSMAEITINAEENHPRGEAQLYYQATSDDQGKVPQNPIASTNSLTNPSKLRNGRKVPPSNSDSNVPNTTSAQEPVSNQDPPSHDSPGYHYQAPFAVYTQETPADNTVQIRLIPQQESRPKVITRLSSGIKRSFSAPNFIPFRRNTVSNIRLSNRDRAPGP